MKIDNKIFKDFITKRIESSSENTKLTMTDNGITMNVVDPTMVALSETTLNKSTITNPLKFEKLSVNNLPRLDKVMKALPAKGQVDITTDDSTVSILTISELFTFCKTDEELILEQPFPKLDFDTSFKLSTEYLKRIITMAETFSDSKQKPIIDFIYEDKKLIYKMDMDGEVITSNPITVPSSSTTKHTVRLSFEYLQMIIKKLTASDVIFHIKTDHPLQINEKVGDFITSMYVIAPRMEDDEVKKEEPIITDDNITTTQ